MGLNDIQEFLKLIKKGLVVLIDFRFHLLNCLNLLLLKLLLIFEALLFFKVNFIAILSFRIVAFDDLSAFRKVEIPLWNWVLLLLHDWFLNNQVHALNQLLRDIETCNEALFSELLRPMIKIDWTVDEQFQ